MEGPPRRDSGEESTNKEEKIGPIDLFLPALVLGVVGFFIGGPLLAGVGVVIGAALGSAFPVSVGDADSETGNEQEGESD